MSFCKAARWGENIQSFALYNSSQLREIVYICGRYPSNLSRFNKMTPEEQLALLYQKFPEVNEQQREQFAALWDLYTDWNSKINVISRKDIDNLYMHHVLHSLGITTMLHFTAGSHVIDVGTGGGFPGIPLAILFPEVQFTLVDSIGKKIRVAQSVADSLGLQNVTTHHIRIEELREKCDFVVTRATMLLGELVKLTRHLFSPEGHNALPNGIIALKGGNLDGECAAYKNRVIVEDLYPFFSDEYYEEKRVLYLPMQ